MSDRAECQWFEERLEALPIRSTDPAAREELERHAAGCPACASLLRMRDILDLPTTEELEAEVPDLHVRAVRNGVRDGFAEGRMVVRTPRGRRRSAGLVRFLVAAVLLLAVGTGGLAAERARLLRRQAELAERLREQERRLTELESSKGAVRVRGTALLALPPWERLLATGEPVTLGTIRGLLARAPSDATLLDASALAALVAPMPLAPTDPWSELLRGIDASDGLQAGELGEALEELDWADETSLDLGRAADLYRATLRAARS